MEANSEIQKSFTGTLRFNKNWNKKLNCDYFTTLRLISDKFVKGNVYRILLEENGVLRTLYDAVIIDVRNIRIYQITDWMSCLDSGLSSGELKDILYWMYKNSVANINEADFAYIMLQRIKNNIVQGSLFMPGTHEP